MPTLRHSAWFHPLCSPPAQTPLCTSLKDTLCPTNSLCCASHHREQTLFSTCLPLRSLWLAPDQQRPHQPTDCEGGAPQPKAPQGPFTPCSQLSREGSAAGRQPCSPPNSTSTAPLLSSLALPQPQDHAHLGQAPAVQPRHKKIRPSELL